MKAHANRQMEVVATRPAPSQTLGVTAEGAPQGQTPVPLPYHQRHPMNLEDYEAKRVEAIRFHQLRADISEALRSACYDSEIRATFDNSLQHALADQHFLQRMEIMFLAKDIASYRNTE